VSRPSSFASSAVEDERLNWRRGSGPEGGDVVVYWMQQAQRAEHNPALEYAITTANDHDLPVAVVFCLFDDVPEASLRHYHFMVEGLQRVTGALRRRGLAFEVLRGRPDRILGDLDHRMALLVLDRGYLPMQRQWRDDVEAATGCPMVEVETDVVVPVDVASDKLETAARTLRPRIHDHLERFLVDLSTTAVSRSSVPDGDRPVSLARSLSDPSISSFPLDRWRKELDTLSIAREPGPVAGWTGGTPAARARLGAFCRDVLPDYSTRRNRYDLADSCSRLSPYLHFGQISPVAVALAARSSGAPADEVDAFIEELVVRRELAINYVVHQPDVDSFTSLPPWARRTLDDHSADERPTVYTAAELEAGKTGDRVWNAIMTAIRTDGWVHNQLRMYWGKQILYWTNTPGHAFRTLLDLNNRYFLDGRDPNSYANVAWCFGRHDQGFQERDVIGKVRPFTDAALRRKGDLDAWLASVTGHDEQAG
jgi:deoxyribodipyrimidine photo-lyase